MYAIALQISRVSVLPYLSYLDALQELPEKRV